MKIELKTSGKIFSGWMSAEITRSLRAVSGQFGISYTGARTGQINAQQLKTGDECEIILDGQTVITGFIDSVVSEFGANSHRLYLSGRDKTGNIVDSGSLMLQKAFKGVSLKSMASQLANPFGVSVSSKSEAANTSIEIISLQFNETIWEMISRVAHNQGVLVYPDDSGNIYFSDVGTEVVDTLDLKKNILELNSITDSSQKFQEYIVVSHNGSADDETKTVRKKATDKTVKSPRVKIISLSGNNSDDSCQKRANWEMAVHTAKSFHVNVVLSGWRNSKGNIWNINELVELKAEEAGINKTLLIETTKFLLEESRGMVTQLTLVLPDSYLPEPKRSSDAESGINGNNNSDQNSQDHTNDNTTKNSDESGN